MSKNTAEIKSLDLEKANGDSLNIILTLCIEAKKHSELIKSVGAVSDLPPLDTVADAKRSLIFAEKTAFSIRLHYINICCGESGLGTPFPIAENADDDKISGHDYTAEAKKLDELIRLLEAAGASPVPEREIEIKKNDGEKNPENLDKDIMIKVMLLSPQDVKKN